MANVNVMVFATFWLYQIVSSHLVIQEPSLELTYDVTEYNYCLVDEFKLQQYVGRQLDDCVTECAIRPHCKALTYHPLGGASSLCELFQSAGSENNVRPTGCVYIGRKDITIEKMSCDAECEYGTTCNMTNATCEHTECANLPNITNGKILGNICAVGKKIQFKCDTGVRTDKDAVCQPDGNWSVSTVDCITPPGDCKDLYDNGNHDSGVYRIFPARSGTEGIEVRCDMTTPPCGWTIIQRRIDGSDFYKTWSEYRQGFGDLSGSYWLGNDYIWKLTSSKPYRLRIDLTTQDGETGYAEYDDFSIEDETLQYALNIGGFHGDVGDSLANQNGMKFTTKDRDNDYYGTNCAVEYHGAWWYNRCHESNLNGDYMNTAYAMGLNWFTWKGIYESMMETEMKIYPA